MNSEKLSKDILSDITIHMKYAKYSPTKNRRETWVELCLRNMTMHIDKYPKLESEIKNIYHGFIMTKKVLPSMRSMQFAGKPIQISPNRVYNCAYMPINSMECFGESMFLLLGGTGVGYSVQRHHVIQLPEIRKPNPKKTRRFLIADSIEGWGDAIKILMKTYFGGNISTPVFDYTDIRPKGSPLITSGGKSPGPAPLRECLVKIENMLKEKEDGLQLSPIEVHDIMCYIAEAVLAGGIRRAALISLFSADDMEMITCKTGTWWENNPQRGRANNSAVLIRNRVSKDFFMSLWDRIRASGSGEPGIYFSNDKDWGTNPCCEIALRPYQFCNLTEINASSIVDETDFYDRCRAAAFIGTLQAGYTDFHYLREVWKKTTERDALLGVSMTGIASNVLSSFEINMDDLLKNGTKIVLGENKRVAHEIGIKPSSRLTCVKPAGTTSLTLGTSSGIHAWHSDYYIRRVRVNKNESIYNYLIENHPSLIEDEYFSPHDTAVISVPQKAPEIGTTRLTETALSLLERVRTFSRKWVRNGHTDGINTHNVSATISVKEDEWDIVGEWLWTNREYYNGLSVLPYDGGTYKQAPFESITKEKYEEMILDLKSVDLTKVVELEDNTNLQGEIACAGGACEI